MDSLLFFSIVQWVFQLVCLLLRRLGPAASGEHAVFSLHELAGCLDDALVPTQYVPLFSLLRAPALPPIQTKLAELVFAEGVTSGGLDAAQHLAASLQPNGSAVASLKGKLPVVQPHRCEVSDQIHVAGALNKDHHTN